MLIPKPPRFKYKWLSKPTLTDSWRLELRSPTATGSREAQPLRLKYSSVVSSTERYSAITGILIYFATFKQNSSNIVWSIVLVCHASVLYASASYELSGFIVEN